MFIYLDATYQRIENCFFTNMQWRRRYYDIGEWEMQLIRSQYIPDAKFVLNTNTLEVGEICKVELNDDKYAKHITLSGYMVETWLCRGINLSPGRLPHRNIVNACKSLVQDRVINDLGLSRITIGTCKTTSSVVDGCDENDSEIGIIARSLLMSIEYAQKLKFDIVNKRFIYEIWQGVDRTIEGPNYMVFSDIIGNINNISYSDDDTDIKNYAHIRINRGQEKGTDHDRIITTSYSSAASGEELRKMLIEISDTESETDEQAIAKAKDQAKLELLNHMRVTNISFTPVATMAEYGVDYDLGDKILQNINDLQKTYSHRIVGINEVYKYNTMNLELIFGDLKKLKYDKRRL